MRNNENDDKNAVKGPDSSSAPNVEQQNIFTDLENNPGFIEKPVSDKTPCIIKVIGIGGGGNNANRM